MCKNIISAYILIYQPIRKFIPCSLEVHYMGLTLISLFLTFMANSLPNDKILDWSKIKALADGKINVVEELKFVSETVENIVGKGENAGYQHFLLFPQHFQKSFQLGVVKSRDCVIRR